MLDNLTTPLILLHIYIGDHFLQHGNFSSLSILISTVTGIKQQVPTTYLCTSLCATESALSITFFATFYVIRMILVKGGFFPRYFKSQDVFNPFLCETFDRLKPYAGISDSITVLQNPQNIYEFLKLFIARTKQGNFLPFIFVCTK